MFITTVLPILVKVFVGIDGELWVVWCAEDVSEVHAFPRVSLKLSLKVFESLTDWLDFPSEVLLCEVYCGTAWIAYMQSQNKEYCRVGKVRVVVSAPSLAHDLVL